MHENVVRDQLRVVQALCTCVECGQLKNLQALGALALPASRFSLPGQPPLRQESGGYPVRPALLRCRATLAPRARVHVG